MEKKHSDFMLIVKALHMIPNYKSPSVAQEARWIMEKLGINSESNFTFDLEGLTMEEIVELIS